MGLIHPVDLGRWRAEVAKRPSTLATGLRRLRRPTAPTAHLVTAGPHPDILVVLDGESMSSVTALSDPVQHLDRERVAVLSWGPGPDRRSTSLPPGDDRRLAECLPDLSCVVSTGHFLELGATAHRMARRRSLPFLTIQHGVLTPLAPPLGEATELVAWSGPDAEFWRSGRDDVTTTVAGSQLLWKAARHRHATSPEAAPVFLGQFHGHELPRRAMAEAALGFCREHGALYRPHPSETDLVSRFQHRLWRQRGVAFAPADTPLAMMANPVVGMFSTGILEAAAAGRPAWVHYPSPPRWLAELWDRYGMAPFGSEAPTAVPVPATEPALTVAGIIVDRAEGRR